MPVNSLLAGAFTTTLALISLIRLAAIILPFVPYNSVSSTVRSYVPSVAGAVNFIVPIASSFVNEYPPVDLSTALKNTA